MTFWEQWGDPALADFNGAMWTRVRFNLTAEQAGQPAVIHLGAIDDFDRTFINGRAVCQTYMYDKPRNYKLTPGLLRPGTNEVVVYILDTGGGGGFWGPAEKLKLTFATGAEKPLGQGWEFSPIPAEIGTPPLPPWDGFPGPTTLYNGMIAPLGRVRLKGVAWYQGEADVGKPGYDLRLAAMMKSWRARFGDPELPFLIVGLAGFGHPSTHPGPSNRAALINEQRIAADRDPRASLVSAIDIGERDNIHPPNKQEVETAPHARRGCARLWREGSTHAQGRGGGPNRIHGNSPVRPTVEYAWRRQGPCRRVMWSRAGKLSLCNG